MVGVAFLYPWGQRGDCQALDDAVLELVHEDLGVPHGTEGDGSGEFGGLINDN